MQNEQLQQTQIAERKISQRYTELFEFAPVAYFFMDLAGIINQLNLRAASLLNIDRANVEGKTFVNYIRPEYKAVFSHCLASMFKHGGIQTCEIEAQVGKRIVWLSVEANIDDLDTNCLIAMIDITDGKLAEDKLKLAANVFSFARESIMITDAKSTIIDVNETFTITTGYSREEAIGKNQRMLRSGRESPDFYVDMWQEINTVGHWKGEVLNRRKNGEVYTELLTISTVMNEAGRV
jgi:PAS domain S-box-containing protein